MILELDGLSETERERIYLEALEARLEQMLAEAHSRSAVALAQLFETFPSGAERRIVRGIGFDPNGGTGVSKLEEECVDLEDIAKFAQVFLAGVRQRLALLRGDTEEAPN